MIVKTHSIVALIALPCSLLAQRGPAPAAPATHPATRPVAQHTAPAYALSGPVDTTFWGNVSWRNIGPNSAGRMV